MKSKKAQIGTLQTIIITLVVIGIVLGIGFLVLREFEVTLGDDTGTVGNETITPTDGGIFVAYNSTTANLYCYHSFSPVTVTNNSGDNLIIGGANYSYNENTGMFWNLTAEFPNAWNISYTYQYGASEACEGLSSTIDATNEIPAWLIIIVILFIVGILLAIVFRVMPTGAGTFRGAGSGGGVIAEV